MSNQFVRIRHRRNIAETHCREIALLPFVRYEATDHCHFIAGTEIPLAHAFAGHYVRSSDGPKTKLPAWSQREHREIVVP